MSSGAGKLWRKVGGRVEVMEGGSGWVARSGGWGGVVIVVGSGGGDGGVVRGFEGAAEISAMVGFETLAAAPVDLLRYTLLKRTIAVLFHKDFRLRVHIEKPDMPCLKYSASQS